MKPEGLDIMNTLDDLFEIYDRETVEALAVEDVDVKRINRVAAKREAENLRYRALGWITDDDDDDEDEWY
jgi:hypothetical protein